MRSLNAKLLLALLATLSSLVHADFSQQTILKSSDSSPSIKGSSAQWKFDDQPSINSTSHLVFSTVDSLLQHWPNTRYRNGHTIVPATIPVGTLLYHGTFKEEIPRIPEWVATDPEHSYLFCRNLNETTGCWQLTLVTTRPLKVLYFDGSSAAKMYGGPMDSQDLAIWGEVKPEWTMRERERIVEICKWGEQYGLDGFLRMEMDFEIMLCDFTAGVQTVSFLNLAPAEGKSPKWNPPPNDDLRPKPPTQNPPPRSPLVFTTMFRVLESGSWHNHFPGDIRIQLDYSRLISFYDTATFPSLQAPRFGQKRLDHRLDKITKDDAAAFQARLREALTDTASSGSDANWKGLIKVVTNRYAERLEVLQYILNSTTTTSQPDAGIRKAHRHIRSMLAPYTLYSAVPPKDCNSLQIDGQSWAAPVFEQCATMHTRYMDGDAFASRMTPSESLILDSVKGVTKEICRVLASMWAEGMEQGLADPEEAESTHQNSNYSKELITRWSTRIENLMGWLDWSHWLRCRPACSYEEMCYLPTWPFFSSKHPFPQFPRNKAHEVDGTEPNEDTWEDPQPMCIRRLEPFM